MKIPQVIAETQLPVQAQPHASPEGFAQGGASLVQLGQSAQYMAHVAGQIAHVERAKYLQGVKIEAATLQSQMELGAETALQGLKLTETDPDAYSAKAKEAIQYSYNEAFNQAKYPETKALLAQHLQTIYKTKGVEAMKYSNQLYINRNLGLLDVNLSQLKTLAANAPVQPETSLGVDIQGRILPMQSVKGALDYYKEGEAAIRNATPLLPGGEKGAADKILKWRQDFLYDQAENSLRRDPMTDITAFSSILEPAVYDRLLTRQDTLRREARIAAQQDEAQIAKAVDHENQNRVGEIEALLLPTTGDPNRPRAADLINFYGPNGVNVLKPGEFKRLSEMVTNPKDFASDPATKSALLANVYRIDPQWNAATVNALHQAGKLNDADTTAALNHIQATIRSNQERSDNKELTALKYSQSEAQRIGDGLLNPSVGGMLEKLDQKILEARASFQLQMYQRSKAFGYGNEDPRAVMNDVLPPLARKIKQDTDTEVARYQAQIGAFTYKTPQDLKAAYDAKAITRKQYENERDTWLKLDAAQKLGASLDAQIKGLFTGAPSGGR